MNYSVFLQKKDFKSSYVSVVLIIISETYSVIYYDSFILIRHCKGYSYVNNRLFHDRLIPENEGLFQRFFIGLHCICVLLIRLKRKAVLWILAVNLFIEVHGHKLNHFPYLGNCKCCLFVC